MMGQTGIKSTCRNCNRPAPADSFKLHYKYKMMVCPDCFSGKTEQKAQQLQAQNEGKDKPGKPVGWDMDDEYLEKMSRMKRQEQQAQFSKVPGTEHVQCRCAKCKYEFKYNPFTKLPHACPYCNTDVPKMKTFNVF